jgi:hypothetical protein
MTATRDVLGAISLRICRCLPAQDRKIKEQSGNVPFRVRDARNQPRLDGIDFKVYSHDWDRTCGVLRGGQSPSASGEDHIHFARCEFKCKLGKKFRLVARGSMLENNVRSLIVSNLA